MASNLPVLSSSKSAAGAISTPTTPQSQTGPISGGEGYKRSGGSGSFGAGATSRGSAATPRNKQTSKNQHKHSRRYRFPDEDAIAESAAMNSTRNRQGQTSITHLMTFALPPRPVNHREPFHQPRHVKRSPTWGLGSGYHVADKARYVHANYRFIVDPRRDYYRQSIDADVYLDWNNILQILASPQTQSASCPICLGDPVAPRMARCGHIFCLHCLIRFMHSNEDATPLPEKRARWKRCPICEDTIYVSETRPVRWYIGQEGPPPREQDDVVLRLVIRPAGSTLALPRDTQALAKDEHIPWHFAVDVMDYARVMKGSEDYMNAQFDAESTQIAELERHDELMFGEDNQWTRRAIRAVAEAKEKIKDIGNPPSQPNKPEDVKSRKRPAGNGGVSADVPEMYLLQHAARSGQTGLSEVEGIETGPMPPGVSVEVNGVDQQLPQRSPQQQQSLPDYYFYQALSHYYLSPLDIRILKTAFGDFSVFPSSILPRVEHVSTGHVVDDELRRRTKYLSHLPYGCEVAFLECDWTDTVSASILEKFKPEIEKRRKRNEEKNAREEKERIRAEREEEDKRYAAARRRRPTSPTLKLRPEDFEPLSIAEVAVRGEHGDDAGQESTSPMWRAAEASFASLGSPGTSPSASRTVWGTTAIVPTSPTIPTQEVSLPQEDGWLQGWERDLLAEEELVTKVESASLQSAQSSHGGGAVKKRKGKKITLMSTAGGRRGA